VRTSGKSVGEVCCELDLTETAVCRWLAQADIDAHRRDGWTTAERDELSGLRGRTACSAKSEIFFEKAAAFFAKETTR
jgi:transposase